MQLYSREGSGTVTLLLQPGTATSSNTAQSLDANFRVLTLRQPRRVQWVDGTIDNEGMQKKSSKRCCIFTKRRSEEDDTSDEEGDNRKDTKTDKKHTDGCCNNQK
ncbi:hypothetical protein BgAZ_109580 [Babesia gibsoni]|uniref:Protein phosphatase inhibitor n=1 Tax=Babesia gibsoni TaxID=33632 RepID=A0AAD8PGX5_BABGI|nr:hypothetical protein BgAZ_109580 [Babesia gibsoni]